MPPISLKPINFLTWAALVFTPGECPQPIKEEYLLTDLLEPTNESYAIVKIAGIKLCRLTTVS